MTFSLLTCQPKTSKGFNQLPFLDTPTYSMTLTNSSCNFNVSGSEFGDLRQLPRYTGFSRMRTKLLVPASPSHGCAKSYRFWAYHFRQAFSIQATPCDEARSGGGLRRSRHHAIGCRGEIHSFIPFTACRGHAALLTSSSLFKHPPAAATGGTKFVHSTVDIFLQHAR
jgi:hypothetical protein